MKAYPDIFSRNLPPNQVYKIRHRFLLKSPNTTVRKASAEAAVNIRDLSVRPSKMKLQTKPQVYNNVRLKHLVPEKAAVTNLSFSIRIPKPAVEIHSNRRVSQASNIPPLIYHKRKLSNTFDRLMGDLNAIGKEFEALSRTKEQFHRRSLGDESGLKAENSNYDENEYDPIVYKKLRRIGVDSAFLGSLKKIGVKPRVTRRSQSEVKLKREEILRKQLTEVKLRMLEKEFGMKNRNISISLSDSSRSKSFQNTPVKQTNKEIKTKSASKRSSLKISRRRSDSSRSDLPEYKIFRLPKPHIRIMNNPLHKLLNKKRLRSTVLKDFNVEDKLADLIRHNIHI
jgi:hypothetical protein